LDFQIFVLGRKIAPFDFAHIRQIFSKCLFGAIVRYQRFVVTKNGESVERLFLKRGSQTLGRQDRRRPAVRQSFVCGPDDPNLPRRV
jgi:hypothetical protein